MDYKKLSVGLGLFSLALAATELLGARRLTRALDAEGHETLVRGFGAREAAASTAILAKPDAPAPVWGRVAGDALDLGTLGLAARHSPRNRAIWGALAFVAAATALDTWVAIGLGRQRAPDPQPAAA